jgi:hypothetical protein
MIKITPMPRLPLPSVGDLLEVAESTKMRIKERIRELERERLVCSPVIEGDNEFE